jgi:hypothetical protein
MKRIAILHARLELEFEPINRVSNTALIFWGRYAIAESSTSSQGSDLFAEIFKILATSEYDDLANQVANIYAPSQERPAESSTSSQGSDLFAEMRPRARFSRPVLRKFWDICSFLRKWIRTLRAHARFSKL